MYPERGYPACKTKIKITVFNVIDTIDIKKRMKTTNNHKVTLISENKISAD